MNKRESRRHVALYVSNDVSHVLDLIEQIARETKRSRNKIMWMILCNEAPRYARDTGLLIQEETR